jgi:hypothetical protein
MIIELVLAAAVVAAGVVYAKHSASSATVASVKAEIVKIEGEAVTLEASAKTQVLAVVARLKALL